MPNISEFKVYDNIGRYFARFDHMRVKPTRDACQGFLTLCTDLRDQCYKLPPQMLKDETRAYMAIKNGDCASVNYYWQDHR